MWGLASPGDTFISLGAYRTKHPLIMRGKFKSEFEETRTCRRPMRHGHHASDGHAPMERAQSWNSIRVALIFLVVLVVLVVLFVVVDK